MMCRLHILLPNFCYAVRLAVSPLRSKFTQKRFSLYAKYSNPITIVVHAKWRPNIYKVWAYF